MATQGNRLKTPAAGHQHKGHGKVSARTAGSRDPLPMHTTVGSGQSPCKAKGQVEGEYLHELPLHACVAALCWGALPAAHMRTLRGAWHAFGQCWFGHLRAAR